MSEFSKVRHFSLSVIQLLNLENLDCLRSVKSSRFLDLCCYKYTKSECNKLFSTTVAKRFDNFQIRTVGVWLVWDDIDVIENLYLYSACVITSESLPGNESTFLDYLAYPCWSSLKCGQDVPVAARVHKPTSWVSLYYYLVLLAFTIK